MKYARIDPEKAQKIYELIAEAADRGERCPSNKTLSTAINARSTATASIALQQLVSEGTLTIVRRGKPRVVEITATGKRTAERKPAKPHERKGETKAEVESRRAAERQQTRMDIAARVEADQARLRERRTRWLALEQRKYDLPKPGRPLEEMPA